jgi:lipopolysaccharide export system protein LptA
VKNSFYKSNCYQIASILVTALGLTIFLMTFAFADDQPQANLNLQSAGASNPKLHITSDSLISDNKTRYAEFIGNVKLTQGSTVIQADRLKIYFKDELDNPDNLASNEESIKKIIAKGDVTINFDNKVATGQQAVYITETKILVLTGENSKIISGTDSVTGEKITFYRTDGRISVEGNGKKKVEAVFYPKDKGIN